MDCSPPGSSFHGILQARILECGCHALLQGVFLTQGSNLCLLGLLHWQADSLPLVPLGKPKEITLSGGGLVTKMCPTLATPWTVACQPPFMGFSRQEYWSKLPFPSPGHLPNARIGPGFPASQADSLPTELQGSYIQWV